MFKQKNKQKNKNNLPLRANVLFFIIFIMFSVLILRLGFTQIVKGEDYQNQVASQVGNIVSESVPRGVIYDRNNNVVVGNSPQRTITYTRSSHVTQKEMLEVAEKLAIFIEVDTSKLTDRDKKDFWILRNEDEASKLVSEKKKKEISTAGEKDGKSTSEIDDEIYQLQLKSITDKQLATLNKEDLEVLTIFSKMKSGTKKTPQIIKSGSMTRDEENNVSDAEFARVNENLEDLPGVDTTTDWQRMYPFDKTLRTILGNVTTSDQGLPSDAIDQYLVRDYSRNDRVGTSYIEQVFEDVLHGTEIQLEINADEDGNIIDSKVVNEGSAGSDLILTIDMELQQKIEKLVEDELWALKQGNPEADRAFVVMMNPKTSEILSLVGKQLVPNEKTGKVEMRDYALGTFTSAYEMGSVVKGATLLTAWQSGATKPEDIFRDETMRLSGQDFSSWTTMGNINDLTALARSSNIYMAKSVLAMSGTTYVPNGLLKLKMGLFDELRYSFHQFGLGVKTGIELPNETAGQIGGGDEILQTEPGKALHYAIGQYDTYTPLQLAQYVSTIANGGYRMKPQIIKEIRELSTSEDTAPQILESAEPIVLNKLEMKDEWIERVQTGFQYVMQRADGTAYGRFHSASYKPAGKTGTAQKYIGEQYVENHTLVAYAPYDNPEVAISVVVPWVKKASSSNQTIGRAALDAYFELKEK